MDELIELSRGWIKEKYGKSVEHMLKAEEWQLHRKEEMM